MHTGPEGEISKDVHANMLPLLLYVYISVTVKS